MPNTHQYKNPPLVEAVFEMFFTSTEWSSIIPGLFYTEIKSQFPKIKQSNIGFGISFDNGGIKIGSGNNEITQYLNNEEDTIIQLSNNMLTVNKLPKYNGWENYRILISFAVDTLKRVLNITSVQRIGLKTLNKIDIGSHSLANLKKHFTIYPSLPSFLETDINSLQLNIESPIVVNEEIMAILLVTLKREPNYEAPVMFQLYTTKIANVPSNYQDWLETAHNRIYEIFNQSLTEFSKTEFDNVQ